jgi:carnitine 3-dehydrogenase
VRRIAVVGTGVIGASWATRYLARGFDVIATEPAQNAEASLRRYVDTAWQALAALGLSPKASPEQLCFTTALRQAVAQADFVQESTPDKSELKIKLFGEMVDATPTDSAGHSPIGG